jgi:hypothetical protein
MCVNLILGHTYYEYSVWVLKPGMTTTPHFQNPPPTQPLENHSLLHQSTHTTNPSLQNPPTEQALMHHSPPHVAISMSPPRTAPPLQTPPPS